jgi:solute carrier family 35, member F1/2
MFWVFPFNLIKANLLNLYSYKYLTITNITLISALTTPFSFILSKIFLKRKYRYTHYIGTLLCLFGYLFLTTFDYIYQVNEPNTNTTIIFDEKKNNTSNEEKPLPMVLLGNLIMLIASICYALSNVGVEYCLKPTKNNGLIEYLSTISFFSVILNVVLFYIFDFEESIKIEITYQIVLLYLGIYLF